MMMMDDGDDGDGADHRADNDDDDDVNALMAGPTSHLMSVEGRNLATPHKQSCKVFPGHNVRHALHVLSTTTTITTRINSGNTQVCPGC